MKGYLVSLTALTTFFLLGACGGKPATVAAKPAPAAEPAHPPTPSELMVEQLAQVDAYCRCTDEACKSSATAEMRRLIGVLMDEFVKESKKSDFDPNAPFGDREILEKISARVVECGVPRDELKVEMPEELKAIARKRMAEYAEKSKKNAAEQIAALRTVTKAACEGGGGEACYQMARTTQSGEDAQADAAKVFEYLERSCKLDYGEGCRVLAEAHRDDEDDKSLKLALGYFEKGCEHDDAASCMALSDAYKLGLPKSKTFTIGPRGLGVKKNKKKARFFEEKAKRLMIQRGKELGIFGTEVEAEPDAATKD